MSFFARASWPGDHRDEIVAGALAAAVIVVLGYASGIGAPADQAAAGAPPPAVEAPASPSAPGSTPPDSPAPENEDEGAESSEVLPVGGIPADGAGEAGENAGAHDEHGNSSGLPDDSGHSGHASPTPTPPPSSTPSPSSPSDSASCDDGEVRLVQPLLKGVLTPVTGLLDGLTGGAAKADAKDSADDEAGEDDASDKDTTPCVGLASDPALLTELTP